MVRRCDAQQCSHSAVNVLAFALLQSLQAAQHMLRSQVADMQYQKAAIVQQVRNRRAAK